MKTGRKEKDKHLDIWIRDDDGNIKKLNVPNLSHNIKEDFHFITLGEVKPEILYYKNGYYRKGGEKIIGAECQTRTDDFITNSQVNEVLGQIKRTTQKDREDIIEDPNEICCGNGILNLKTFELKPHTPDKIFTQKIIWSYIPAATCPKIKKFISELLKEEDIPVIQEYCGYMFFRKYFIKKATIFVGEKDTGKTTLIKLIVKLIGNKNTSGLSLHSIISDRFGVANMEFKLLNVYDDLSFKDIKETGSFKIATGGGFITAEKKFGDSFMFMNYAKQLYATNKISAVANTDDDAYFDRWMIIFFNNVFPKNKDILPSLTTKEEMRGFFVWALEGLHRLLKNEEFSYTKSAEDNKLIMERSSNTISAFTQDCLIKAENEYITKEDMFIIYSKYVDKFGGAKVTKDKFGKQLPKKITYVIEARKTIGNKKGIRVWDNVKLFTDTMNTVFSEFLLNNKNNKNNNLYRDIFKSNQEIDKPGIHGNFKHKENIKQKILELFTKYSEIPIQNLFDIYLELGFEEKDIEKVIQDGKDNHTWFEMRAGYLKLLE